MMCSLSYARVEWCKLAVTIVEATPFGAPEERVLWTHGS